MSQNFIKEEEQIFYFTNDRKSMQHRLRRSVQLSEMYGAILKTLDR